MIAGHRWAASADSDPQSHCLSVSDSAPAFVQLSGDFVAAQVLLLTMIYR